MDPWADGADVKVDKHRENYLGNSVRAPVGRWQNNRDIHWYTRDGARAAADDGGAARRRELDAVKAAEDDAMLVALYAAHARTRTRACAGH